MTDQAMPDGHGSQASPQALGRLLKDTFAEARAKIVETVGEERVNAASEATRKGLASAGKAYKDAETAVTQSTAWAEVQGVLDDLVEVASSQHAMILDLLDRLTALEERCHPEMPGTGPTGPSAAPAPPRP